MRRNDRLSAGPSIPALALRVLALAVALAAGAALDLTWGWLGGVAAAVVIGSLHPMTAGIWVAAAVLVGGYLAQPPGWSPLAVTIAAVHLLHVLGSLILVVRMSSRISLAALRATAIRFVMVQSVSQTLGFAALLTMSQPGRASVFVLAGAAAALAVIAAGVWAWHRQRLFSFAASDRRQTARGPRVGGGF